jgi:pyrimidine-nucleoside phosphorylase
MGACHTRANVPPRPLRLATSAAVQKDAARPSPVALIAKKRDGHEHTSAEVHALVAAIMDGSLADYQTTAWLMAAFLRGLGEREMVALTDAMLASGDTLKLGSVDAPKVDKHSTGGVGDKISICLGPLVAACGAAVPMIAGRGLGHTGGTLDKLESIPGYDVHLDARKFERVVREAGVSIIGQTARLAPADKRIYALRDVTGTVACIPLIVASILSKKLAEGIDALVLDVKVGRGAFMPDRASAEQLARSLVRVGKRSGKRVTALLTDMDAPIGRTIGNALEVREAIDVLRGGGPADTRELTLLLGAEMLVMTRLAKNRGEARQKLERAMADGSGLERLARMVRLQGGDARYVLEPERLPKARHRIEVRAPRSGYVNDIDALGLADLAVAIGAGRKRAEDVVDPAVGIELCVTRGDALTVGAPLALLHVQSRKHEAAWVEAALSSFSIGARRNPVPPILIDRLR